MPPKKATASAKKSSTSSAKGGVKKPSAAKQAAKKKAPAKAAMPKACKDCAKAKKSGAPTSRECIIRLVTRMAHARERFLKILASAPAAVHPHNLPHLNLPRRSAPVPGEGTECYGCSTVFCDACFDAGGGECCGCCEAEPMCGACMKDYEGPEFGEDQDGYYCERCKEDPEIMANP